MVNKMNDAYMEYMVKKKKTGKDWALRIFFILLCVLGFATIPFLGMLGLVIAVIFIALTVSVIFPMTDLEYEYLYLDKQITVDKIMAQSKRKQVAVYDLERIEIIAPMDSYHLDAYKGRNVTVSEYWSMEKDGEQKPFVIFYEGNQKIVLDLPIEFVKMIQNNAPRKVFLD